MAKKVQQARDSRSVSNDIPLLLEFTLTFSQLLVVITAVLVVTASILSGNNIWMTVLQTGIAVLAVGLLIWLANWFLSEGLLESTLAKLEEEAEKERMEREAREAAEREIAEKERQAMEELSALEEENTSADAFGLSGMEGAT